MLKNKEATGMDGITKGRKRRVGGGLACVLCAKLWTLRRSNHKNLLRPREDCFQQKKEPVRDSAECCLESGNR